MLNPWQGLQAMSVSEELAGVWHKATYPSSRLMVMPALSFPDSRHSCMNSDLFSWPRLKSHWPSLTAFCPAALRMCGLMGGKLYGDEARPWWRK